MIWDSMDPTRVATITEAMLDIKRHRTGIGPKYLEEISGTIAKVDIERDDRIAWSKIEAGR